MVTKKPQATWVRIKPNEIKKLVIKYAKQGKFPSQIGIILRDEYGIPNVKQLTGKNITGILEEANFKIEPPENLRALIKKSLQLKDHLEEHQHDYPAKRSLAKTEARIRKLAKYYKEKGKLDRNWKYQPEKVKLMLQ